ncbi:hypothetical protein HAV22_22755 [Massilia sp. TW-1]|jgi:hypothetical protein|uniref:Uncharacterized protein n=2 Tax=Telluria group TaxID=2895353 RepID=A0ABX0PGA4_9BURK|nr:hypothetical protein [Telluria antibiotica]
MMTELNIDAGTATQAQRRMRTDMRTRDLVNQAVASVPTLGLQRAAEFLAAMGVPAEIAVRALVYPNRRRTN